MGIAKGMMSTLMNGNRSHLILHQWHWATSMGSMLSKNTSIWSAQFKRIRCNSGDWMLSFRKEKFRLWHLTRSHNLSGTHWHFIHLGLCPYKTIASQYPSWTASWSYRITPFIAPWRMSPLFRISRTRMKTLQASKSRLLTQTFSCCSQGITATLWSMVIALPYYSCTWLFQAVKRSWNWRSRGLGS